MKDIAWGITELATAFEYTVAEYAKKHGLEVNRLMLIILDALREDIKKGVLEMTANTSKQELEKVIDEVGKQIDSINSNL